MYVLFLGRRRTSPKRYRVRSVTFFLGKFQWNLPILLDRVEFFWRPPNAHEKNSTRSRFCLATTERTLISQSSGISRSSVFVIWLLLKIRANHDKEDERKKSKKRKRRSERRRHKKRRRRRHAHGLLKWWTVWLGYTGTLYRIQAKRPTTDPSVSNNGAKW